MHRCREADEQSASVETTTTGAGVQEDVSHGVQCGECGRSFRRPGDLKRHKCAAERAKPVEQQRGGGGGGGGGQSNVESVGGGLRAGEDWLVHKCRSTSSS